MGTPSPCTQVPSIVKGYFASIVEPFKIFHCRSQVKCPGGIPGERVPWVSCVSSRSHSCDPICVKGLSFEIQWVCSLYFKLNGFNSEKWIKWVRFNGLNLENRSFMKLCGRQSVQLYPQSWSRTGWFLSRMIDDWEVP